MENRENQRQPEILKDEALRVVNALKFEDYEEFSYHGTEFLIILVKQENVDSGEENKEEVFFMPSSQVNGYDIYMLDSLPIEEKRKRMFHQIIQASLLRQSFDSREAHAIADRVYEEVYGPKNPNQRELYGIHATFFESARNE